MGDSRPHTGYMTQRTDIHRPSSSDFDPENYVCHGVFDKATDAADWVGPTSVATVSHLVDEGYSFSGAPHGSRQCSHCGAHLRYAALMTHEPTKTMLYVGETCLDNRFSLTQGEFARLRAESALNRDRIRRTDKVTAFLCEYPDMVWLSYANNIADAGAVKEQDEYDGYWYNKPGTSFEDRTRMGDKFSTLSDMWHKVNRYGDMSENAVAYARKILGWIEEAAVRLEQREAATASLVESGVCVPTGKVEVEGTVVSIKFVPGFNSWDPQVQKMVVKHDDGWKVYVTVPRAIYEVTEGQRVRFTATLEPSRDDVLFGFGKRPTKAEILDAAEAA